MIHAFAIEPQLVATWGHREEFRYIHDKFGIGSPRVLLELPAFNKWKREVYTAACALNLSQEDMKRIEELFRLFSEHKHRRAETVSGGLPSWLENAEHEHGRRAFTGILAKQNPRSHAAVLVPYHLDRGNARWACDAGAPPQRTAKALALALSAMLTNCRQLHLVDPHFGPELRRYGTVLAAFLKLIYENGITLDLVRVHCTAKSTLSFFENAAEQMASWLPAGVRVEFVRWQQRPGGDCLHNRYVLTDVGGVSLGVGLDEGAMGETDDLSLLTRAQYLLRWSQYVEEVGAFDRVDEPRAIVGSWVPGAGRNTR